MPFFACFAYNILAYVCIYIVCSKKTTFKFGMQSVNQNNICWIIARKLLKSQLLKITTAGQ